MPITRQTPGVYLEEAVLPAAAPPPSGVPLFLGVAKLRDTATPPGSQPPPVRLMLWADFDRQFQPPPAEGHLAAAVRGFFDNGGQTCFVQPLDAVTLLSPEELSKVLKGIESFADADLIAAPDVMPPWISRPVPEGRLLLQQQLLEHCDRAGGRFAILDAAPGIDPRVVPRRPRGTNGALYYSWVQVDDGGSGKRFVPPCGHVAGVYARCDRRGVHKAPANEVVEGVLDLEVSVSAAQQGPLNEAGVNCLRAFPGRGVVVWGVRTLSGDPAWRYVSVRRLFLALGRWAERNLAAATFEPNDAQLWARLDRELTAYLQGLFRDGAAGRSPQEAFYVKCDGQINTPEVRDAGQVIAEVGLAATPPCEFIVVRVVQTEGAAFFQGPAGPA